MRAKLLIGASLVFIAAIAYFAYAYATRPADSEYQTASTQLSSLQSSARTIDKELSATPFAAAVDNITLDNLRQTLGAFEKSADFSKTIIVQDSAINKIYQQHHAEISEYSTQVHNLIDSIDAYLAIVNICQVFINDLVDSPTITVYNEKSTNCNNALNDVNEVPASSFKSDFLDKYRSAMTDLVATTKQYSSQSKNQKTTAQSAVNSAYVQVISLGRQELSYGITAIPSTTFDDIQSSINSQKSAFIH